MTTLTLDDFREHLVAAVRKTNSPDRDPEMVEFEIAQAFKHVDYYASFCDHDEERKARDHRDARAFHRAARIYVIARDQGVDAAVLWKLQNGGEA